MEIDLSNGWQTDFDEEASLECARAMSDTFALETPAKNLAEELKRELSGDHQLSGASFTAIARSLNDPNDFIFKTSKEAFPLILVHLTWTKEVTTDYPRIETIEIIKK